MANRFGRNQKRKMRQEIEQLNQTIEKKDYENKKLDNIVQSARMWDKEIAYILGEYSAFRLQPPTIVNRDHPDYFRVQEYTGPIQAFDSQTAFEAITSIINVKRLILTIKEDPISFRKLIKLFIRDDKGLFAMYISDEMIDKVGLTPKDIEYLSRHIAIELAHHFNKAKVNEKV